LDQSLIFVYIELKVTLISGVSFNLKYQEQFLKKKYSINTQSTSYFYCFVIRFIIKLTSRSLHIDNPAIPKRRAGCITSDNPSVIQLKSSRPSPRSDFDLGRARREKKRTARQMNGPTEEGFCARPLMEATRV
jgi:hypothetical protein